MKEMPIDPHDFSLLGGVDLFPAMGYSSRRRHKLLGQDFEDGTR
jgi:hypothetical protein